MEKLKLTLPKSYEDLVSMVQSEIDSLYECDYDNRTLDIDAELGFLGINRNEEKLIAKIFLADEIEFVEEEYFWSLKGIDGSYVHVDGQFDLSMVSSKHTATALTESELKAHLNTVTIGVPFDAFMKEEVTLWNLKVN